MNAYDEKYLDDAMKNLGEAFDYAINSCEREPDEFARLFVASGVADYYGKGNPKYVAGKSGMELVMDIIATLGENAMFPEAQTEYDCSAEYWAGWILAYYQWKTGRTFRSILNDVSVREIVRLYPTLHEASEDKCTDTIDSIIKRRRKSTKLQLQRKKYGCSQRELAEKTGVNIRTLQQYELDTKDISKASVGAVLALANALGCSVEDVVE